MPGLHHPFEAEELMAHLDGELSPQRATGATGHLSECAACRAIAADLQGVSRLLAEWHVSAPQLSAPVLHPPIRTFSRRLLWTPLTAVCVLVAIFLAGRFQNRLMMRRSTVTLSDELRPGRARMKLPPPEFTIAPRIVHSANISLVATNFPGLQHAIADIARRRGGFLSDVSANTPSGFPASLNATLRIPDAQLDLAISEIEALGSTTSETRNANDVTSQSVDLDARLTNARNTERRLTALLQNRTGSLADVLAVQNQIDTTRGQIEQLEAQRKALTGQEQFATITVYASAANAAAPGARSLAHSAAEGWTILIESISGFTAFLLSAGPMLLFWSAILFFPIRWILRRFQRPIQ